MSEAPVMHLFVFLLRRGHGSISEVPVMHLFEFLLRRGHGSMSEVPVMHLFVFLPFNIQPFWHEFGVEKKRETD